MIMLTVTNLKLVRKLSILFVLTVGLFFAASANLNNANASFCCSTCEPAYKACKADCLYHFPQNPARYAQCVQINCDPELGYCEINCDPLC